MNERVAGLVEGAGRARRFHNASHGSIPEGFLHEAPGVHAKLRVRDEEATE